MIYGNKEAIDGFNKIVEQDGKGLGLEIQSEKEKIQIVIVGDVSVMRINTILERLALTRDQVIIVDSMGKDLCINGLEIISDISKVHEIFEIKATPEFKEPFIDINAIKRRDKEQEKWARKWRR